MSLLAIKAALETRLKGVSSPLATAWENATFDPPNDKPYQSVTFLPAAPENPTFGDDFRREVGIMQVSLFYPINGGAGAAYSKAEAIQAWFARGMSFTANGVVTTIERTPEIGVARIDDDKYVVPVRIRYFANIMPITGD